MTIGYSNNHFYSEEVESNLDGDNNLGFFQGEGFLEIHNTLLNDKISSLGTKYLDQFIKKFGELNSQELDILLQTQNNLKSSLLGILNLLSSSLKYHRNHGGVEALLRTNFLAKGAQQNIEYFCKKFQEQHNSPFIKYKTQLLLQDLQEVISKGYNSESWDYKKSITLEQNIHGSIIHTSGDYQSFLSPLGYPQALRKNRNHDYMKYEDLLETMRLDNNSGLLSNKELGVFMQEMHSPEMLYLFNKDLDIHINRLSLQTQIYLLQYLWDQDPDQFENFKSTLSKQNNKYTFLTTFLACSKNPEIGDKILDLAQFEGSEEIFESYANLVNLQSEIQNQDTNSLAFLKATISRGEKLLLQALDAFEKGKDYEIGKEFSQQLVRSGAFVKSLMASHKQGEILSMDEFNEKSPDFKAGSFGGGTHMIVSNDPIDMLQAENYPHPELFGVDDYKMLLRNLHETYRGIDDGWLGVLTRKIASDLQDPNVTFFLMREKVTGKLSALCKSNNLGNGEVYLGSHYVEPEFRGDFGIGDYVMELAIHENRDVKYFSGSVSVNNPSLERHINYGGFIGTSITYESDEIGSSRELIGVERHLKKSFLTKDKSKYPDSRIKKLVGCNRENFSVVKIDSRYGYDSNYIDISRSYFGKGYAMTRIFYEKVGKTSDLSQTYIVFEKDEEL